ncbi:MAG: COX15/CtaA family protein [Bacteroidetes bacterium]|nr:COX15/CtaA family protein [Bacteroidota bacterium]MDA1120357.1 COX15/CtaA family protein [Bacteroidota bacterium]
MVNQPDRGFYPKFLLFTIASVCFLIFVGGIVRSTGSGMGCPDWPKCFESLIPPTSSDQLPDDYEQIYLAKRQGKNLRLANYVEAIGFSDLAVRLRTDQAILLETLFNPAKTWIEYLNRVLGVIIGLLVFLNVAITIIKPHRRRFIKLAILIFLLTGFQGWVGSIVVSTNLLPGIITFHMALALIILGMLIYNYWLTRELQNLRVQSSDKNLNKTLMILMISFALFSIQIVLGTQVREAVDQISGNSNEIGRDSWISLIGTRFYIHRSFSLLIAGMHAWFVYLLFKYQLAEPWKNWLNTLLVSICLSILTGILLSYLGLPPFFQPLHLVLATVIFGIDLYLILELGQLKKVINSIKNES